MKKYSLSEAAHSIGLDTHNLHYWEGKGFIQLSRDENGRKYATEEQMKGIKKLYEMKYKKI